MVEVKAASDPTYAPVPGEEQRGEGVNSYIYWVANDLLGEWTKLPDLRGDHVAKARKVKRVLTGELDTEVDSYPFYEDKERYLLRAQIARITAATVIAPKGVYKEAEASMIIAHNKINRPRHRIFW